MLLFCHRITRPAIRGSGLVTAGVFSGAVSSPCPLPVGEGSQLSLKDFLNLHSGNRFCPSSLHRRARFAHNIVRLTHCPNSKKLTEGLVSSHHHDFRKIACRSGSGPLPRLPPDRKNCPAATLNPDPAATPIRTPGVMLATRSVTELSIQSDISPSAGWAVLWSPALRFTRHDLSSGWLVRATVVAVPATRAMSIASHGETARQ